MRDNRSSRLFEAWKSQTNHPRIRDQKRIRPGTLGGCPQFPHPYICFTTYPRIIGETKEVVDKAREMLEYGEEATIVDADIVGRLQSKSTTTKSTAKKSTAKKSTPTKSTAIKSTSLCILCKARS